MHHGTLLFEEQIDYSSQGHRFFNRNRLASYKKLVLVKTTDWR